MAVPIYALAWNASSDEIVYTSLDTLVVKRLQTGRKAVSWKAHGSGNVLCVDWNAVNRYIVSGGEDAVYKIWDAHGRQLFSSSPSQHSITSIAWAPSGSVFVVGSYGSLRLLKGTSKIVAFQIVRVFR